MGESDGGGPRGRGGACAISVAGGGGLDYVVEGLENTGGEALGGRDGQTKAGAHGAGEFSVGTGAGEGGGR